MKNLIGYLMISVIHLMSYVSLTSAQRVGRGIGRVMMARRTRSREVTRVNLSLCYPEQSETEREQMIRDVLMQSGMTGAEMGPMWGYTQDKLMGMIRTIHNEHLYDEVLSSGKGVLLMVPHLGNWEIISTYAAHKSEITAMYRPAKIKSFNDWMVTRRKAVGANMVATTGEGVRALFDILKRGGVVGFLPDQEPKRERGVFAPFMGVETLTPNLPHQLIQDTGCKVIFAFAKRLPNSQGFDLHFVSPEPKQYDADQVVAASAMNSAIATCIEQCPSQYQWTYKRFKRRPEGEISPYNAAGVP